MPWNIRVVGSASPIAHADTIDRPAVKNALESRRRVNEIRPRRSTSSPADADVGVADHHRRAARRRSSRAPTSTTSGRAARDDGLAAINSSLFAEDRASSRGRRSRRSTASRSAAAASWRWPATSASPSDTAKFGQPELGLGIIPGAGATQRLPRIVGLGWAKHLDPDRRHHRREAGARDRPGERRDAGRQLQIRARELAKKILRQGPLAARLAKLALNASARVDLDSGLLIETLAQAICYSSEDKVEGTTAFLEKRKPKFTGK